jgi:hypothetical protein
VPAQVTVLSGGLRRIPRSIYEEARDVRRWIEAA